MKNKHMQMNKILVMMLCAAMTVEPAAAYGADFTDGIEIKTEIPEASEDLTEPETQKTVPEESSEEFSAGVVEQNEEESFSAGYDEWDDEFDDRYMWSTCDLDYTESCPHHRGEGCN